MPYQTDGTSAGTVRIALPSRPANTPFDFWPVQGAIAITSVSGNTYGLDFIAEDGTVSSWTQCPGCILQRWQPVGTHLYFVAMDTSGHNTLYRTSGSVAGTQLVCPITAACGFKDEGVTLVNGFTYAKAEYVVFEAFSGKTSVYQVGKGSLTLAYTYLNPPRNQSDPTNWDAQAGDQSLFANYSSAAGSELWATDGTQAGRHKIKTFYPGQTSGMQRNPSITNHVITAGGKALVIGADPYVDARATAFYVTDGTSAGTKKLKIDTDDVTFIQQRIGVEAQLIGSKLYYLKGNNTNGRFSGLGLSMYVVDLDTGAGPTLVKWVYQNNDMMIMPSADMAVTPAGWIYTTAMKVGIAGCTISGSDFVGGKCDDMLFRLDPDTGKVQMVANPKTTQNPQCESTCDGIRYLTAAGNQLLFSANDNKTNGNGDAQPWFSSGTPATTFKLKDIASYLAGGSKPYQFVAMP